MAPVGLHLLPEAWVVCDTMGLRAIISEQSAKECRYNYPFTIIFSILPGQPWKSHCCLGCNRSVELCPWVGGEFQHLYKD